MDEPELVIQSIREVVDAASQKKSESPWMQPGKLRPGGFGGSLKGNLKR
jgi:hypothetical protein